MLFGQNPAKSAEDIRILENGARISNVAGRPSLPDVQAPQKPVASFSKLTYEQNPLTVGSRFCDTLGGNRIVDDQRPKADP